MRKGRPHLKHFQTFGDVLSKKSSGFIKGDLVELYRIQKNWETLVGKDVALRTYPKDIRGQTLVIAVENPAWSQQLSMMKETLLEAIVKHEKKKISKLQFATEKLPPDQKRVKKIEPTTHEGERTAPVHDDDLESSIARIRKLQEELQKNRR